MNYEIDLSYSFTVLPGSASDNYFNIEVDGPEGKATVQLSKLEFQKAPGYVIPPVLYCRVKNINEKGLPVLTHVVAPYIYSLYQDLYARGETFECEVVSVPDKPAEEPYMLRDRNGIFYRYSEPEIILSKGQKIQCKFLKLTPRFFQLTRVDDGAKLPFYSPSYIFDALDTPETIRRFAMRLIMHNPDMASMRAEIESGNPLWLVNGVRAILDVLPRWFMSAGLGRRHKGYTVLLDTLRDAVLFLLEGSGFLNALSFEHRLAIRRRLTEMVESFEPYHRTLSLIEAGRQDAFVDSLLDKLRKSGYLYHPAKQFAVLMLIFKLYPQKVANYLSRIFESIFGRDLENWKREPFSSAFVEQFEIYINLARSEIDDLPLGETREQKSRLETIITAIALQLLLADSDADLHRSTSLFYRYISILRPLNTEALLSKSFIALMGADVNTSLSYRELKEPMMMMTRATILPPGDILRQLATTHRFSNGSVEFTVSSAGLQLSQSRRRELADRVIPEGLMPWLSPQILLNGIRGMGGQKTQRLSDHHQWWQDIENALFETSAPNPAKEKNEPAHRFERRAEKGDEVFIVIDGVGDAHSSDPTFYCHIEDSEFCSGTGILKRDQIVGYNMKYPVEQSYKAPDGSALGFLATVLDVRPDGSYIFSLRDEVDRIIDELFNYDDEYVAIVAGVNGRDYSAISRDGVGLFLERDEECSIGDIVYYRLSQKGGQGQLRGYITRHSYDPNDKFDKSDAFTNLMHCIGEAATPASDELSSEEPIRDLDEILTTADIREIIGIIHFKAIAESDLIKAYDYLRYGRLLALLISDSRLASKLATHAALLTHHQYYAKNSCVEAEKLQSLREDALADPLLRLIFYRLEMVSWLGHPERIPELYKTVQSPSNELEGSIARLVLSYNMLGSEENGDASGITAEIRREIKKKLNVNNETRKAKYYGSESKYLEFKTSLVYPAIAPGQEMQPNPEAQQMHILSRIAGMLNAGGGRLYIGVNNDGYEVGMHDDFKYYERKAASIGNYTFRIRSLDNLCVFIENLVNETFGASVARKIAVSVDDEAEKGVILIDIKESLDPVFIDGRLFVRQSGQSTREYHGAAIDDFIREREELRAERIHNLARNTDTQPAADTEPHDTSVVRAEAAVPPKTEPDPDAKAQADKADEDAEVIATSRWRPNVLHSYEAGYIDPYAYIYFIDGDKMKYSYSDIYLDTDDNCRLALLVPQELADGSLVLGYENERVLRIPLSEIFEKDENTEIYHNSDYRLLFAAIASKDDLLVCLATDSSDSLWQRAVAVGQLDGAHLMSTPRRIHDAPVHRTFSYELADASASDRFADSLADSLAARRFGTTMRVKTSSPMLAKKIESLVHECMPANNN